MIITRFAPSPTGNLHIGGARTALFSYLYAKHLGGKFVLRIEDTDKERSKDEFAEQIKNSLNWLGIYWDNEEIPYQSKRLDIYTKYRDILVSKNLAYFKDGAYYIKGKNDIEDFVIWKSDGMPVFHFAVVIDDHEMGVTDIVRGVDHLTNTDRHKIIYDHLELPRPRWYHLPLIVDENGKPLSKRRNDASVDYYIENEYLPEAVMNYLARLGWGHGDQEIFSKQELIDFFDVAKVSKNPARIDAKKLNWMNSQYINMADIACLKKYPHYQNLQKMVELAEQNNLQLECLKLLQQKAFTFKELDVLVTPFIADVTLPENFIMDNQKFIQNILPTINTLLKQIDTWTKDKIEATIHAYIEQEKIQMKDIAMPLRLLLTGQNKSLGLYEILFFLGKNLSLKRLSV